ncbi:hypothetical protein [Pseudomonas putida]
MMPTQTLEDRWADEVSRRVREGGGLEFSVASFASQAQVDPADIGRLEQFLRKLVEWGSARQFTSYVCPIVTCQRTLLEGANPDSCPFCNAQYLDQGVTPIPEQRFVLIGEASRDIRWMVVIHGMNSRAPWQEAFSWEVANLLKYSAPVLIYKYGWATYQVLFPAIQRKMAKSLGRRIRTAIERATASRRTDRPDVIAHSFGTRLFSMVLEDPEFADLRFGHVITAGSIIRPDFNWARQFDDERVEAVLNHVAAKDGAVPFAVWSIPGAGPGGKVGYASNQVMNVRNHEYGHSSFFEPENLPGLMEREGVWSNYFTRPLKVFRPDGLFKLQGTWRSPPGCQIVAARAAVGIVVGTILLGVLWVLKLILCWFYGLVGL